MSLLSGALVAMLWMMKPGKQKEEPKKSELTDEQIKAKERAQAQYKRDIDALMTYTGDKQE